MFKEESGKHINGMQWWKQFKSYAQHNNLNELWQYFDVMESWNGVDENTIHISGWSLQSTWQDHTQIHSKSMTSPWPPGSTGT